MSTNKEAFDQEDLSISLLCLLNSKVIIFPQTTAPLTEEEDGGDPGCMSRLELQHQGKKKRSHKFGFAPEVVPIRRWNAVQMMTNKHLFTCLLIVLVVKMVLEMAIIFNWNHT